MSVTGSFRADGPLHLNCEVLVIGAGAGGATAAHELVNAGKDVLLLDEGPAGWMENAPVSGAEGVAKLWRNGGLTVALGAPPVAYAEGRCVGGGTEINSAIVQRAPNDLLNRWAEDYRIANFGAAALHPYYDKAFHTLNASLVEGPLGPPSELFRTGAEKKGWKFAELERAQSRTDKRMGAKQSLGQALVQPALNKGLRLLAQCRAHKLVIQNGKITGAKARATGPDGRRHSVTIKCQSAFLAAGAVHTPALLRASGVTANVGNSLRLHPTIKILAKFPFKLSAHLHHLPLYAVTEFMPDIRLGGSVFTPGFFGMALAEDWENRKHLLPAMDECGMYYAMVRAGGTGMVRPLPGHRGDPLVTYRLTPADKQHLRSGLLALAELMLEAGATQLYPSLAGHKGWTSLDQARFDLSSEAALAKANLMTIHLFSSCPMGEDLSRCPVDSFGRVRQVQNLYIADASLIPEAPGVNPQATIMAIAYRNIEAFLQKAAA
ncbi:MAG TPA: GMC family oxidoreductase [Alphaproteobacteria bacterium]|nr:GMC family oxidoreductase [Alphaproteobacteria bacterium]